MSISCSNGVLTNSPVTDSLCTEDIRITSPTFPGTRTTPGWCAVLRRITCCRSGGWLNRLLDEMKLICRWMKLTGKTWSSLPNWAQSRLVWLSSFRYGRPWRWLVKEKESRDLGQTPRGRASLLAFSTVPKPRRYRPEPGLKCYMTTTCFRYCLTVILEWMPFRCTAGTWRNNFLKWCRPVATVHAIDAISNGVEENDVLKTLRFSQVDSLFYSLTRTLST